MPFSFAECDRGSDARQTHRRQGTPQISVSNRDRLSGRTRHHRSSRVLKLVRGTRRDSQCLVDRRDDTLVVGVGEVIEDFRCFVRTDADYGVDRGQQQRLLRSPRSHKRGDVRPGQQPSG